MKYYYLLFILIPLLACTKTRNKTHSDFQPKIFSYKSTNMPDFFKRLVENHYRDFHAVDGSDYDKFCSSAKISNSDSLTAKKFYSLKILHQLFTSTSASNGSKGEILNIPYFWHWVNPNPRYEIISLKTNQKLNKLKPPKEFSKYLSKADIDRTPYLFLSEMISDEPLYSSVSCGKFSTFGWCSEREMAFVCLLNTMEFTGKVITEGNHSWSEFIVPISNNTKIANYKFKVDNTFDSFEWEEISKEEIIIWKNQSFQGQGNWYNQKALSLTEQKNVSLINVSSIASKNIEEKVVAFLKD